MRTVHLPDAISYSLPSVNEGGEANVQSAKPDTGLLYLTDVLRLGCPYILLLWLVPRWWEPPPAPTGVLLDPAVSPPPMCNGSGAGFGF